MLSLFGFLSKHFLQSNFFGHDFLNSSQLSRGLQCEHYLDVHGSVHRNINLIERTNKMRLCSRIYYSIVS